MMPQSAKEKKFDRELMRRLDLFAKNHRWIRDHHEKLSRYEGRWVAVHNGKVLASSRSLRALYKRFCTRQWVAIVYVDPPGPGLVRILALGAHSTCV
jgi:hypothetical protein